MRVVIVGIGDIGLELAENLVRHGRHELVLIDADEARAEHVAGRLDALVLHGDGTDPEVLGKARITEADALVATTGSDAINTVIAMLGQRRGVKQIIVKLNDTGLRAACQAIGVQKIIAPKISAAAEILGALYGFDRLDFSMAVRGGLRLIEVGTRRVRGRRLGEVEVPGTASVVAVFRGGGALLPRDDLTFERDDVALVLIERREARDAVRVLFDAEAEEASP